MDIDVKKMDGVINKLCGASGPGLMNISNNHMKQMWKHRDGTNLEPTMKKFTVFVLNGEFNIDLIEWTLATRCVPANKINPGKQGMEKTMGMKKTRAN